MPKKKQKSKGVPILWSKVSAGFPSPADEYVEDILDLNELLITNKPATYLLRVSGDSMIGAGIFDNDILVVDASVKPKDKSIVVASVDNEFLVKRWVKKGKSIFLQAENPRFAAIEIEVGMDANVFGVVTGVVRRLVS